MVKLIRRWFYGQAEEEIEDSDDANEGKEDAQHEDGQSGFGQFSQAGDEGLEARSFGEGDGQIFEHEIIVSDF